MFKKRIYFDQHPPKNARLLEGYTYPNAVNFELSDFTTGYFSFKAAALASR
jgi:hypothetical protein